MDAKIIDPIRYCAFCPNVCRFNYPAEGIPQKESMFASAMSFLGYAASKGLIHFDEEVASALSRLEGVEYCRNACPYHFNIPDCLRQLVSELKQSSQPKR